MNKETILRLTDVNVDGCKTDVITDMRLLGPVMTEDIVNGIHGIIKETKENLELEYTTDEIIDAVANYLETLGYKITYLNIVPDFTIEF